MARTCHAHTHTTFSPNVVHGGQKTNIIPDVIDLEVDIRTVPGDRESAEGHLRAALGDLYDARRGERHPELAGRLPHRSAADNALWNSVEKHTQIAYPGATLVPGLVVGGTDARFYRERGRTAYGAGLFSPSMDFATFGSRFHGHDERIDVESLGLSAEYFRGIAVDLLT